MKEKSVSARISNAVREAIFSGELRPGDPLLEVHLAKEFQVSQTSVREGLLNLELFGLVRRVRNKGTFVTKLSQQDLKERVDIRMLLEEFASVQAAHRMKEEHFKELRKREKVVSTAISHNAYSDVSMAELSFHRYIWENSGSRLLCETLEQLSAPLFAFASILRSSRAQNLKGLIPVSHQEIVSALRSGEPQSVRDAVRAHFYNSYNGICDLTPERNRDSSSF
jgi:DNA-binding GntR family transcriptional regulator